MAHEKHLVGAKDEAQAEIRVEVEKERDAS